jgi:hypothetical protein
MVKMNKCLSKGGVVINDIEIGDTHFECEYGCYIECAVITKPVRTESTSERDGKVSVQWTWKSKNKLNDKIIDYLITEGFQHYGPNLYNEQVYMGLTQI